MRKTFTLLLAVVAMSFVFASGALAEGTLGTFELKTGDGKAFKNENITKTTVFVVVQTACTQCRTELKDINDNYDDVSAKADFYAVLVDMAQERALSYYNESGYKLPVVMDPNFTLAGMAGVGVTPSTIIVDAKGNITYVKKGYRPGQLDQIVENL